jgi:acyl dehydratase
MLKGLAASGWHVCCFMMKMATDYYLSKTAFMGAPGVEEVKWRRPLYYDRPIMLRMTVLEKRASRSRPEMGFIKSRYELLDEGQPLMELRVNGMFERRDPEAASA